MQIENVTYCIFFISGSLLICSGTVEGPVIENFYLSFSQSITAIYRTFPVCTVQYIHY
jgi:hypothetical protein